MYQILNCKLSLKLIYERNKNLEEGIVAKEW